MKISTKTSIPIIFSLLILLILLAISTDVYAYRSSGQIGLMTVAESSNGTIQGGGTADLNLAIRPGTGRIFIDSFPLSKLDTQITMRFATEVACDFLDKDCSNLDFFYTIRADSAIVGGPSAGAAATVLAVAMLDDRNINNKVIMTGTIDSGYLIGPVAGISEKTLAAQNKGYQKVLLPKWDLLNESNETISKSLTIPVIPVTNLADALYQFTGKNYSKTYNPIYSSENYTQLMKQVTIELCSKYGGVSNGTVVVPNSSKLIRGYNISGYNINGQDKNSTSNISGNGSFNISSKPRDYFQSALSAADNGEFYSAASFCFAGNVQITQQLMKNYSSKDLKVEYAKLLGEMDDFDIYLKAKSENLSTISELETYMVVRERLDDAKKILSSQNPENISSSDLAYAIERFETAKVWSKFFALPGKAFVLDKNVLSITCNKKIEETEERINYLQTYYPRPVDRTDLSAAYAYQDSGDYALCIFTASKAKADVDVILGVLFIPEDNAGALLNEKLGAVQDAIARQESKKIFPILGYSYYEYSNTLKDTDTYSALLYAEYGLELSNLNMYFPAEKSYSFHLLDYGNPYAIFFLGFSLGILFVVLLSTVMYLVNRHKTNQHKNLKLKHDQYHKNNQNLKPKKIHKR